MAVLVLRRAWARTLAVLVGVVLLLASAAQAVNAYYGYYPTLSEALGGPSPGEASLARAEAGAADGTIPAAGQVVPVDLPGTVSGFAARQARVYLPPAWSVKPRPTLPVVMLLHGTPGDPANWTDGGAAQTTADAWAAQHHGVAPVLVMPDINGSLTADTECVDSPVGNAETYLTVDVPAAVQKVFGTAAPGPQWAIAGLSEGGTCAIMLALRHPALFSAFGDFGGLVGPRVGESNSDTADTITQLFGGSQQAFEAHEPAALLRSTRFPSLGGWFQVGTDDAEPLAGTRELVPLAKAAGISSCLVEMPGQGHTFDVWSAAFRQSLPWLAGRVGLVPRTDACP
ncbi:alpha/beta hydrolase [Pseudonocardia sp. GCM10023141]|uniref:alpha/beta hydrolase n=1 Tax=Pseudonocardia sp. GCM10023141 TaxID=3252653 RepID=UPI00361B61CA